LEKLKKVPQVGHSDNDTNGCENLSKQQDPGGEVKGGRWGLTSSTRKTYPFFSGGTFKGKRPNIQLKPP